MRPRTLIAVGLAILLNPSEGHARTKCKHQSGKEINPNNGNDTKGISGWITCKYSAGHTIKKKYKKGRVMIEEWLDDKGRKSKRGGYWYTKNGNERRHGKWVEWYENGKKKRVENYKHGDEHGPQSYFNEDGSLHSRAHHFEDKKLGEISYNDDGSVDRFVCYEHEAAAKVKELAQPCGWTGKSVAVTGYYKKGVKRRIAWYERGKNVAYEQYSSSGALTKSNRKPTDKKVGLEVARHKNGKKKQETRYDDKGRFHGVQREFHKSEKRTREARFDHGFMTEEKIYYLNGQLKRHTALKKRGNETRVMAKSYHDNGKLESSGQFIERKRSRYFGYGQYWNYRDLDAYGVHKTYREDGTLARAEKYKDGELEGVSITLHENGVKKLYEDSYEEGRRVRHKEYDLTGRLVLHEEYFEDGSSKRHTIKK